MTPPPEFTAFPHAFAPSEPHRWRVESGNAPDHLDNTHPLVPALAATVPFAIHDLIADGGPNEDDWQWARAWNRVLAEKGDILLMGEGKKGEVAKMFADLVRVVSILSFMPGGITLFDTHYEAYQREAEQPQP